MITRHTVIQIVAGLALCCTAWGQGALQDVLAGKLVQPKVGVWAWYDLTDTTANQSYMVRLAVVGEEKVGAKTGHWLEIELVPRIGFRSIYKMLLTGPANDQANVHKIVQREGTGPVQEVDFNKERREKRKKEGKNESSGDDAVSAESATPKEPERTLVGEEDVSVASGPLRTQHFACVEDGKKTDLWLSEKVPPMGLVQMKSPDGELLLRSYGEGGRDGKSAINAPVVPGKEDDDLGIKVDVKVDKSSKVNKNAKGGASETGDVKDAAPTGDKQ